MDFILTFIGIFGYLFFLIVSYLSCKYTSNLLGSKLNIVTCLTLPIVVISTLQAILSYFVGFYQKPALEYWLLMSLYISITAIVESFSTKFVNIKRYNWAQTYNHIPTMGLFMSLIISLFIVYACYDSYKVVSNIDIAMILQDDGQDEFGTSAGGGFYVRIFLMLMATYYLGYGRDIKNIGIGLLCLFPSLVINTKGVIFIPIIASFIVRFVNGQIKNLKIILISIGSIGAVIFFASYMWEYSTIGENPLTDSYRWKYIGEKLLYYLTAGVQGFSVNLDSYDASIYFNHTDNITIAPFANFFSKLGLMKNIRPVSNWTCVIGNMPTYGICDSNVNTYVGTIFLYNSFLGGILLHAFWVFITAVIRIKALKYKQPFTVCLYALFATGFVLGWFEFYFMQTFWIYMMVMAVILNFINSIKFKRRNARI